MQSLDLTVLDHLHTWLSQGRRAWLVTVTRTFGASPRPPGSMLVMRDDGILVGSVSGGCIEDDLIARRETFIGIKPIITRYGLKSDEVLRFGLPCGGELEVVIESNLTAAQVSALLSRIQLGRVFMRVVDLVTGGWQLQDTDSASEVSITDTHFSCVHGPRWRLLIIGASEIAVYLAEIAKTLDFAVTIVEPRETYRDAWRVADTALIADMPDDAVMTFKPDAHSVIVALSHDLKLDDMALMAALKTPAFYIGAVGSIKTSDARRQRLLTLEVTDNEVAKLHGPTGIDIGSRTPPEIAVSIAAELIAKRNIHKRVTST